jgi:hypothetical protein
VPTEEVKVVGGLQQAILRAVCVLSLLSVAGAAEPTVFEPNDVSRFVSTATDNEGWVYCLGTKVEDDDRTLVIYRIERDESSGEWQVPGPDDDPLWEMDLEDHDDYCPIRLIVAGGPTAFVWLKDTAALGDEPDSIACFVEASSTPDWVKPFQFIDDDNDTCPGVLADFAVQKDGSSFGVVGVGSIEEPDFAYLVLSLSAAGNRRWDDTIWSEDTDVYPAAVDVDEEGGVYVALTAESDDYDVLTIAYKPDGDTAWTRTYGDANENEEYAVDIAVRGSVYDLVVLGAELDPEDGYDVVVLRYTTVNGDRTGTYSCGEREVEDLPVSVEVGGESGGDAAYAVVMKTLDDYGHAFPEVWLFRPGTPTFKPVWRRSLLEVDAAATVAAVVDARKAVYASAQLPDRILTKSYAPEGLQNQEWEFPEGDTALAALAAGVSVVGTDTFYHCAIAGSEAGEDQGVLVIYNQDAAWHWEETANRMPATPSGRSVKDGGWLACDRGTGLIYAAKGYKTPDFYRFDPTTETWNPLTSWPSGNEAKPPYKGSAGCSDGNGHVYATKGNNRTGFWRYDVSTNTWAQLTDVPLGASNKKVKGGADLVYVPVDTASGYVYLLKGYKCEFYRYSTAQGTWQALPDAPTGLKPKWSPGSWLVYDGDRTLYAHKARYHELYAYSLDSLSWKPAPVAMPVQSNLTGKSKKLKDGGSAVWAEGYIYSLKGGNTQEFWRYCPSDTSPYTCWIELDTMPAFGSTGKKKRVKGGGDIIVCDDAFYALKGNKTLELWAYGPGEATGSMLASRRSVGLTGIPSTEVGHRGGAAFGNEDPVFDGYEAGRPRWNSTGTAVTYFREDSSTGCNQVYFVAGGDEKQLTFEPTDCENPVFRPNGSEVAFQMFDTTTERYHICFVNSSFGTAASSADEVEAGDAAPPDAETAPDAGAGLSAESPAPAITAAPVRSRPRVTGGSSCSTIYQLTFDDRDHENPEWSPDGEWLVCSVEDTTGYAQLLRVKMDGSYEEQLTFDEADHEWPKYLSDEVLVYQHSPDTGYDQICKLYVGSAIEVTLTDRLTDYEKPDPAANCSSVVFQGVDDDGDYQIGHVLASGTNQYWLTDGDRDIEEPDISADNITVYAVRWQGLTSEIGWVDISGTGNGFEAITDDACIRDNPDVAYNSILCSNGVVYERENPSPTYGDGPRRRRPGTGIYLTRHKRKPGDGEQTAASLRLALERAEPNPARTGLTIHWQVPTKQPVSLRVYNTAGRLVRVLEEGERAPGRYTTRWNGRDDDGRRLAAGVYFYSLDAGERRLSRKVVLAE